MAPAKRQKHVGILPELMEQKRHYLTFDDTGMLSAAKRDPIGFVAGLEGPVTLDEIQHVPELFPSIKMAIDRKREPGRLLLTGSANVLLLPKLSESLAGRMELLTLWPFSQEELMGIQEVFVDALFSTQPEFHFWRTASGLEVDLVLEDAAGRLVGIEVKAGATLGGGDIRGLQAPSDTAGDRWVRGVVLHTGNQIIPFSNNLHGLPISHLWAAQGNTPSWRPKKESW